LAVNRLAVARNVFIWLLNFEVVASREIATDSNRNQPYF
jgi:hypothetical protein